MRRLFSGGRNRPRGLSLIVDDDNDDDDENRIPRRIFGPKMDENGEWRRLYKEDIHTLYRSPKILWVLKSRRLRWAGHIGRMQESRRIFKKIDR